MSKSNAVAPTRLTDRFIKSIEVDDRCDISDTMVPGLKLRVSANGRKSFAVKARGADGRVRTVSLGSWPTLTLAEARHGAREALRHLKAGEDPTARKRDRRAAEAQGPTLQEVLDEYEIVGAGRGLKIWTVDAGRAQAEAKQSIQRVFHGLLPRPVDRISLEDLAEAMTTYRPKSKGKASANGAVKNARLYLTPVFDWCAGRKRFSKIGAGRPSLLDVVDVGNTFDPSADDPLITGMRDRVLDEEELAAVLPLLTLPLPEVISDEPERGILAHRFILLTAARLAEVTKLRWCDLDLENGIWLKAATKDTRRKAGAAPRRQSLPLSVAAVTLLCRLKELQDVGPDDYVFANSADGPEQNWDRITSRIQEASGTGAWTRHDLRRTSATILDNLGVPLETVARILNQKAFWKGSATPAIKHYATAKQLVKDIPDPQRIALERLAEVFQNIEAGAEAA